MSGLKTKSDLSMISAELLKKAGYHASSIHCSYYGLFQKMKHTIKTLLNLNKDAYDTNAHSSNKTSHKFLIDLINREASKRGASKKELETLVNNIYELKSLREDADYEEVSIGSDESDGAYEMSTNLMRDLKNIFKI